MNRINYLRQIGHFVAFVLLQLPLLYKFILFDRAFAFIYVGFLLLLPIGLNRNIGLLIALATGLLVDVFSNTPGIHAAACVFIVFVKDYWFVIAMGEPDGKENVSWNDLGIVGSLSYLMPLILTHHIIIFTIENGGLSQFFVLFSKITLSSIYTFIAVASIALMIAPKERRQ
jgi:hypothetical protein